jgi:hypothetical protein
MRLPRRSTMVAAQSSVRQDNPHGTGGTPRQPFSNFSNCVAVREATPTPFGGACRIGAQGSLRL